MSCQLYTTAALALGKMGPVWIECEVRWAPGCQGIEYEEETNIVHLPGFEPQFLGRPARSLVTALTELPCFHFSVMNNKIRHFTIILSLINVLLTSLKRVTFSWFQNFALFWMFYAFFWVIPRRLKFICRRFGTLCLFHLHRHVGVCRMN